MEHFSSTLRLRSRKNKTIRNGKVQEKIIRCKRHVAKTKNGSIYGCGLKRLVKQNDGQKNDRIGFITEGTRKIEN